MGIPSPGNITDLHFQERNLSSAGKRYTYSISNNKTMNYPLYRHQLVRWLLSTFFAISLTTVLAQSVVTIQLRDASDDSPIVGAYFQYQDEKGISDQQGIIAFVYNKGEILVLSHLTYGTWQLDDEQVKSALQSGIIRRAPDSRSLQPVTVVALRPKSDETKMLELDYQEKMAHDAGALLSRIPGISSIRKSGGYGFDPVVRGFKYDQINVVLDGVQSAVAACPNRMDPPTSQMAPNTIEHIEILKGPYVLRFGNGFGATINFAGTQPAFRDSPATYGRLSGGYESNGSMLRSEGMLGFSGKWYDLGVFASWSKGDDYRAGNQNLIPADFSRGSLGTTLGLKLTSQQIIKLSAIRNVARDADFPALAMDLRHDDTWLLNMQHEWSLNNGALESLKSSLYGSFVDHRMDNGLKVLDPRMMNAGTDAQTRAYGGRTEATWRHRKGHLYTGADLRIEEAEGIRTREFLLGPNAGKVLYDNTWQDGHISKAAFFTEYQIRNKGLQWVLSGRLEWNQADISEPQEDYSMLYPEPGVNQLNPGISVGGIKNLRPDIAIGVWLGRAQRSGSLTERFINFLTVGQDPYELLGNPNLKPEVNYQADVTFQYRSKNWSLNSDVFVSYLQDFISSAINPELKPKLPASPGVRQFINLDQALITGFELEFLQNLSPKLQHSASIAYLHGQDLKRKDPLPEIAPMDLRYRISGHFLRNKLHPEISLRQVMQQPRTSTEYGETVTPAFFLADLNVSYTVMDHLSISSGIQNVLDKNYYEHLTRSVSGNRELRIYAPGRSYYIALNLDFR
jgi:iron complex outermembrane recepter protein